MPAHPEPAAIGEVIFLIAEVGGLAYPVRDGIPVMLIEEAKLPAGVSSLDELKRSLDA